MPSPHFAATAEETAQYATKRNNFRSDSWPGDGPSALGTVESLARWSTSAGMLTPIFGIDVGGGIEQEATELTEAFCL
jgi:hypothetical protein